MKTITTGSDFSGVGAFDFAIERVATSKGFTHKRIYACDWDKYARITYAHNHGMPDYYPKDVYEREIPTESLDIFMTSPPCQAFSLAGNRKGEDDERGVLFYNSHEFIMKNKPRFFIFENVKGLLSSKSAITYQNSLYLLLYNFKQIKEWESLEYQKNNLNLLSQSIKNYLCLNYAKKLGLKTQASGMSYTTNSELGYEKLENLVKNGLKRRLKFLEERIYQITKKHSFYPQELTVPLGCKEEDLVLNQNQSYLIENISQMVINLLEKTVGINANTSLFAKNTLEDNSKNGKWYTTLTELNSTIDSITFMYVLELNIIRLITLALDLSQNLWKEIWLTLTGTKESINLKTFDVWLFNLDHLKYHVYHKVINSKDHGVPQNRERIFIVGIRDDEDNNFRFPKEEYLTTRLKDVLENDVDEKYFLSDEMIQKLVNDNFDTDHLDVDINDFSKTLRCGGGNSLSKKHSYDVIKIIGNTNPSGRGMNGNVFDENGISPTLSTNKGEGIKVKQLNPSKESNGCQPFQQNRVYSINGLMTTLDTDSGRKSICVPVITPDRINKRQNGRRFKENGDPSFTVTTQDRHGIFDGFRIRRLTPRECFRLQDFTESFDFSVVSNSQAYKQAGNSITVRVLEKIINNLNL